MNWLSGKTEEVAGKASLTERGCRAVTIQGRGGQKVGRVGSCGPASWLTHLPALWPGACYLTSLCLSFLIGGTIGLFCKNESCYTIKCLKLCSAPSTCSIIAALF